MNWFLIALSAPALWAVSNHIDKYLLKKYFNHQGIGALIIFSGLIYLFILPIFLLFSTNVFEVPGYYILLLIATGILEVIGFLVYLYALEKDEASVVAPLFQIMPVLAYIFGYFLLGETLTEIQIGGSLLIIMGAIILSLDLTQIKMRFKTAVFFLVFLASLIFALDTAIFKVVALEENYWATIFWSSFGDSIMGLFFLCFVGNYRNQFLYLFKTSATAIIGINVFNEIITLIGQLLVRYAILLAPLALVQTIGGFQPLFVFFFGVMLVLFFPGLGITEDLSKRTIIQKFLAMIVMLIGTYIINI